MDSKKFQETVKSIDRGIKQVNQSKASALIFLQKTGIATKSGKLTKAYKS
ncbi:hypothetical protein N7E81_07580 [Reichenbachiella carrageenanivorans]|uniref:Uncharacterized protein n=1 Tax=Reichenbachiella carrageenanivorans TaxID=2979869 RepID=A0ABY6D473_9BACT|nr:hypothetical protein [Reichenbachiella carrageenanivorans]UXX80957.1 hypothetical protein N7E81_07580 [Reichenbachiella carrageenanivorans]